MSLYGAYRHVCYINSVPLVGAVSSSTRLFSYDSDSTQEVSCIAYEFYPTRFFYMVFSFLLLLKPWCGLPSVLHLVKFILNQELVHQRFGVPGLITDTHCVE